MRKTALFALFSLFPLGAFAARITLRDGTVVYGNFVSGSERNIIFQDDSGARRRFDVNQVRSLDFDAVSPSAGAYRNGDLNTSRRADDRDRNSANRMDDRQYSGRRLAPGTEISVRTNEDINADTATEGRTYAATINQDVMDSAGNMVIPRGSDARLVVRNVNPGGTLHNSNLVLDLESVNVNGQRLLVSTSDLERGSDRNVGANKRTAEMVGGGAALGTIIGAIAGGGKGAAIGAAVGAAGGAGAQVMTKGDKIRVPAETVLNFRLDQPLDLRPVR